LVDKIKIKSKIVNQEEIMNNLFGVRLKSARLMNGLSMDQLARRLEPGISKQAIGKYEKGRAFPNSENLMALTQALMPSTMLSRFLKITMCL
jgi:transcriptional regulator with XRE-family HTH domain